MFLKWVLNNKLLALCLVALLSVSVLLGITRIAYSIKAKQVEKLNKEVLELKIIQKEDQADIAALKQYNEQVAEAKKKAEKVSDYLNNLDPSLVELLTNEKIQKHNYCLFTYFTTHSLPDNCSLSSKGTPVSGSSDKTK
jgi:hypothetical protein